MNRSTALILTACTFLSLSAPAQTSSGSFLTMLGNDTVAVEQYSMKGNELSGISTVRNPRTTVRTFSATFGSGGKLQRFFVQFQSFGKPVSAENEYVYLDDSVQVITKQDTSVRRFWVPVTGRPFPLFINLFAGWNEALRRAINEKQTKFTLIAGRRTLQYEIQKLPNGSVDLANTEKAFGPMHTSVSPDGQLERFDMTETTDKFVVNRVPNLNIESLGAAFAAREQSGQSAGVLSPRDTVRATVNGAHILVDYGRPSVRGRTIFGDVVPWNVVWRTGANAATQLVTDKELAFGSAIVPAGTYSLFTIPSKNGWLLVINKQHGQWGTMYDQTKDLVRIPLETNSLPNLVEQLMFEVSSQDGHGVLSFRWERTMASAPFVVH